MNSYNLGVAYFKYFQPKNNITEEHLTLVIKKIYKVMPTVQHVASPSIDRNI